MPQRPVLVRLILPFALMIGLVVLVCATFVYWAGQRTVHLQQIRDLDRLAGLVQRSLDSAQQNVTEAQAEQLRGVSDLLGMRITLIGGSGTVLLDTFAEAGQMENHNARPEVVRARMGEVGSNIRVSGTLGEPHVYVARLLNPDRRDGIVVRLSYPKSSWAHLATPTWMIVGAGVISALGVMIALAWLLQRQWVSPVQALSAGAARMAGGQWDTRVEPRGAAELRSFSGKLNVLAAQAQKQLAELDAQRSDLRALVDSLPDPVLLADPLRRVALLNPPAARLLQVAATDAIGKNIVTIVSDEAILQMLDAIESRPRPAQTEQRELRLVRNGQHVTYQAVAKRMAAGGTLLVLRNVSALAQAVQMKTDFVANASHELRTPIAAIKAAFETLQDVYREDPQQSEKCITIIDGHIRRLEDMLADLLDLSRVEDAELKPQVESIRPQELYAILHQTLGPIARQKGVELVLGEDEEAVEFESDKRLLNLILKNLVENSIKFTPASGRVCVNVKSDADTQTIELTVRDTGIGIPPEHLDRVFERFYQVNAARTGSAGRGTGLGLAIVKHATNALGGAVQLTSTVGNGTTVTCSFSLTGTTPGGSEKGAAATPDNRRR